MKNDLLKTGLNSILWLGICTKVLWSLLELSFYSAAFIGEDFMLSLRVFEIASVLFVLVGFLWIFNKLTSKLYPNKTTYILVLLFVLSSILLAGTNYFVGSNLSSIIGTEISDPDYAFIFANRYDYEHLIYLFGLIYLLFRIKKTKKSSPIKTE